MKATSLRTRPSCCAAPLNRHEQVRRPRSLSNTLTWPRIFSLERCTRSASMISASIVRTTVHDNEAVEQNGCDVDVA